ncbi:hypothetical protein [Scytonema sp. NUACC26]|uniref:hypothetical protein n=1 Tax=Scytonema sp. NUACC26 TaxID=3140176 RepID=UPI0034DB9D34
MFATIQKIKALEAHRKSNHLGDFAILKSDLLGAKVEPTVASKLQRVVGYHPYINLEELSKYPQET